MKYTFDELMKLSDKELEDLRKKISDINYINHTIENLNDGRLRTKFPFRSWEIVDLMKYGSLSTAIIVGCYFIGKGLSNSQK